jgi:group I intron endonuclease
LANCLILICMDSGIYAIRNLLNNRRYVGSTINLATRFPGHRRELRKKIHFNPYLQRAWDKYGEEQFVYEIVERCDKSVLLDREEHWIRELRSYKDEEGYNLCRTPRASRLGCKASAETLRRMSESMKGEKSVNWGKKLPKETIEKMRQSQLGLSKPNSGKRKKYEIVAPDGSIIVFEGLRIFCRKHSLSPSMVLRVLTGKQKDYKGWSLNKSVPTSLK